MDRVGAELLGRFDQSGNVQVAVASRGGPDAGGLVGSAGVYGVGVSGRVNGDGRDAELAACTHDANGDLSTIGDEDALEHRHTLPEALPAASARAVPGAR